MRALYLLFFATGAAALALEIAWTRLFASFLGGAYPAIATVVAAFMGGLGAGSLLGGRWADRAASPLALFGRLAIGAGVLALLVPLILPVTVPILRAVHAASGGESPALDVVRVLAAAILLLPPTMLLGATLPALGRAVAPAGVRVGARVGGLYAANTFGAVLGAAAAGGWAIGGIGIRATGAAAAIVDVGAGVAALLLARARGAGRAGDREDLRPAPARDARARGAAPDPSGAGLPAAALGLAATGLAGMMLEIEWTRALVLSVGNSTYAFTVVLAAFVLGIAMGGAIASRVADRIRRPARALGALVAGLAAAAVVSLPVLGLLPLSSIRRFGDGLTFGRVLGLEFVVAGGLVVPAAALSGACFPVACRLAVRAGGAVGRGVGWIAGANTLGAVAGSLLAGFAVLPLTGSVAAAIALTALFLALAAVALLARAGSPRVGCGVLLALAGGLFLARPHGILGSRTLAWDPAILASGPYLYAGAYRAEKGGLRELGERIRRRTRVLSYRDGPAASVAVLAEGDRGDVFLRISGKVDASTGRGRVSDLPTELLLGHLPLLLHPAPERVLVIGLGGGITLGAVARHPVEAVDAVEISADVVEAARRFFAEANGRALEDPRVRTIVADARQHLLLAGDAYDVITSEPSNPWVAGMADLFTEEFFRLCRERLRPGAVMCQWIHATALDPEDLRLVARTFAAVFPGAQVWLLDYDVLLAGGRPVLDAARVRDALGGDAVRRDLERIGIRGPVDLFQHLGPPAEVLAGEGPLHRSDRPVLEFRAPRGLYGATWEALIALADRELPLVPASAIRGAPPGFAGALDRAREAFRAERRIEAFAASGRRADLARVLEGLARKEDEVVARVVERMRSSGRGRLVAALCMDEDLRARILRIALARAPEAPAWLAVAELAATADGEALRRIGELWLRHKAFARAREVLLRAAVLLPRDARTRYYLGLAAAETGDLEAARRAFEEAAGLDPENPRIRYNLGLALERLGRRGDAVAAYREALRLDPAYARPAEGIRRLGAR